jgi:hypothetical protein
LFLGLQGSTRRRRSVLSAAFRGWQEEVQLQQYRRHVVVILSHKVNNGLLLKAFNCWRCACSVHPAWQVSAHHRTFMLAPHVLPSMAAQGHGFIYISAVASCRDVAESKQARRQQLASAMTSWWLTTQRKAFDTWRESVHEAIATRQVKLHSLRVCVSIL